MLDPKFLYLPYIAQEEKDVYETEDIPPTESEYYEEENESESIEKSVLNTEDAYNKFKGKYLIGNVDFSDNIGKGRFSVKGYNAVSGVWEITGNGEKENPIQKCQRLQCEMSELMDEITALQNSKNVSKEEREVYDGVSKVVVTAKKVLDSLRLEQVLGKETTVSSSEKQVKNLISQVEEYKKGVPVTAAELMKLNSQTELSFTTRIAELEHKLHHLEQTLGAKTDKISRLNSSLGTKNLLEAVQQLSTKSALLQPNQLDVIEQRLTNLATKMDQFNDKASGTAGSDPVRDQKIVELYELAKSSEPVTKVLPDILERMKTLETLHSYAHIVNLCILSAKMFVRLILVLFSINFIFCAQLELSNDDTVIEAIRENKNIIVLFTRKCSPCRYEQSLASIRDEFKSSFDGNILRLDSSQLQRVYDMQRKDSSLVFVRKGVGLLYEGDDSADDIYDYISEHREPIVKELDDRNFEHLTQASTGSTTGDWLIQFYDNQCIDCSRLSAIWETVGAKLKSRMNVARVNRGTIGAITAKRFKITNAPEFILLRPGKFYRYNLRNYEIESFVNFATTWYNRLTPEKVKPLATPFEKLVNLVVDQLKNLPKFDDFFAESSSLIIFIPGCLLLLFALFFILKNRGTKNVSSKTTNSKQKEVSTKKAAKKD
ncbi:CLUMA_CG000176, isoform A [Clunio marinus]|uniref:CLUMA_CG000176, isoform A n=1 Tax=Clunio marinus TaxID=568069 RepID=A0A1J1HE32_9DIPT|nr:CLUMA_CG000176, isoform A [Clunio marinus]